MSLPAASTAGALYLMGERVSRFEGTYRAALSQVLARLPRATVCTIYEGNLPGDEGAVARVGLALFNDVILRVAFEHRLPVIDLRAVCSEPDDYANQIEPSSRGAEKIAAAIVDALGLGPADRPASGVFAGRRS
jgi:hypothetical protein